MVEHIQKKKEKRKKKEFYEKSTIIYLTIWARIWGFWAPIHTNADEDNDIVVI